MATPSHIEEARLSPGGQYLFVRWEIKKLGVFDLHDNNSCVWTYDKGRQCKLKFAFEMNENGTIIVLIAAQHTGM